MWELFIHPSNFIFSISICLMLLFGILELILLLLGGGSQSFLEQFLPDDFASAQHAEIGIDADQSLFSLVLDWLYLSLIHI